MASASNGALLNIQYYYYMAFHIKNDFVSKLSLNALAHHQSVSMSTLYFDMYEGIFVFKHFLCLKEMNRFNN